MKRFLSALVVLAIALSCSLFVACGHEHTWASDWSSDATNHWKACTGENCEEVSESAAHTYENGACTVCSYAHAEHTNANGVCTVCGAIDHTYYQVSDTEWTAALSIGSVFTQNIVNTYENGVSTETVAKYKEGVGMSYVVTSKMNDVPVMSVGQYFEIDSVNDKVYSYEPVYDSDYVTLKGYKKEEAEMDFSTMNASLLPNQLGNKANYTYNATTKAYEASSISEQVTQNTTITYTNVSIKFQDGEILSVSYSSTDGAGAYSAVITVSDADVTITFPEPYVERTIADDMAWRQALSFSTQGSGMNVTVNSSATVNNTAITQIMKANSSNESQTVYFKMSNFVENDLETNEYYYASADGMNVYEFTKVDDSFVNTTDSDVMLRFSFNYNHFMMNLNMQEFEFVDGEYVAETANLLDNASNPTGISLSNVSITFADGKLEKIEYTRQGISVVMTAEYGNTVVTLPDGCTLPNPPSTEVTPTEWNAMFAVAQNMTITNTWNYAYGTDTVIGKFALNGMQTTTIRASYPGEELISYFEFDVPNDKVWRYEEEPEGVFTKVPFIFSYTQYMSNVTIESGELAVMENYTYDSTKKAYVAESIVDGSSTYTDVMIKVEDGKIVLISYNGEDSDGAYSFTTTCTYGDTVVDLPVAQPAE